MSQLLACQRWRLLFSQHLGDIFHRSGAKEISRPTFKA
jgi:hypothetical protein